MQIAESVDVDGIDETKEEKANEREGKRSAFEAAVLMISRFKYQPWRHEKILNDRSEHVIRFQLRS